MTDWAGHRARLGRLGESLAADLLVRHGITISDRNVTVGRGELDLVATDGRVPVAVEVKTGSDRPDDHPVYHFTDAKRDQVAKLAGQLGIRRIDLVTVRVGPAGARVEWHKRV